MGLLQDCKKYFGATDLYEILSVEKNCSEKDIKKAYKRLSLLIHPDRVSDEHKEEATKKFQVLSKLHFILSDKEKRSAYDETGEIDEEDGLSENRDWLDYWRLLFPRIKEEDIVKCLKEYQGSEEERNDLKNYYLRFKGDMNKISEYLIGYTFDEEGRYQEIIHGMIQDEEVPDFPKFSKESAAKRNARKRRYEKEAAEADEMKQEMDNSLVQAIAKRANERFDDMVSQLEKKYAKPSPGKGKKKSSKK